jgi:hypothetical protein
MELHVRNSFGFEVLRVVAIRSSIFGDIMLCGLVKVNQHLGGTYSLHLQGQRLNQALLAACFVLVSCLAYPFILKMEVMFLQKMAFTRLHSIISQKTPLHLRNSTLPETMGNKQEI